MCAVLGRSWGLCWHSGGGLGTYLGGLGPFLGPYGRSWAALAACLGGLGCSWAALGTFVRNLGPLLRFSWRSWAAIGAAVCDPGPLLGPILAVCGRSWSLCGRSEAKTSKDIATLKTCLLLERESDVRFGGGGLGALFGSMLAAAQTRAGTRSGQWIWVEKWPWPRREGDLGQTWHARRPRGPVCAGTAADRSRQVSSTSAIRRHAHMKHRHTIHLLNKIARCP